mmetsp:Transcript_12252/g.17975  ORF Transcript_12252/g.17975 Transcript_12252/m.17975 type:complete len:270 (+) Transcript_12252:693-1502(+)
MMQLVLIRHRMMIRRRVRMMTELVTMMQLVTMIQLVVKEMIALPRKNLTPIRHQMMIRRRIRMTTTELTMMQLVREMTTLQKKSLVPTRRQKRPEKRPKHLMTGRSNQLLEKQKRQPTVLNKTAKKIYRTKKHPMRKASRKPLMRMVMQVTKLHQRKKKRLPRRKRTKLPQMTHRLTKHPLTMKPLSIQQTKKRKHRTIPKENPTEKNQKHQVSPMLLTTLRMTARKRPTQTSHPQRTEKSHHLDPRYQKSNSLHKNHKSKMEVNTNRG